jgi:glycerophosphoryl diester phosphodiesterase
MEIIAHRMRGSPDQIGNSERSFHGLRNIMRNCKEISVETDISMRDDGRIIIYHPGTITPDPLKMGWSEIQNSVLNIMPIEDFLKLLVCFPQIICYLDMKQSSSKLAARIIKAIAVRNLEERIYLTAFQKEIPGLVAGADGKMIRFAKNLNPNIKTNIIVTWPQNLMKIIRKYNYPDAISIGWLLEPPVTKLISELTFKTLAAAFNLKNQIKEVKKQGIKVIAGVANDEQSMRYFADLGADAISTDNPELAMTVFKLVP